MEGIGSLPREVQGRILTYYLGNSFARYSYLKSVFSGQEFAHLSELVDISFMPERTHLHFRPQIQDELGLDETDDIQFVRISRVISRAGRYSGCVLAIEEICSDAHNWENGRFGLLSEKFGWFRVVQFLPAGNTWVFQS